MTVEFPLVAETAVSVVIVAYGARKWVQRALQALDRHTEPRYEVVIVDNASPDDTAEWLRRDVRGAKLVFNDRNVGFGPAANQGALHAVGRYLCFLNPDAMVQPGWLAPLLEILDGVPGAGAALPRIVGLDGRLQEAASVVGSDGFTFAYGHGDDPSGPEYLFPRRAEYGSAACLVIARSTFLRTGGFDPAYRVAYCEDVDMCFELAERGLRTVYEPRSTVVHVRGASSDPEAAVRLAATNRRILVDRWRDTLARRPSGDLPARPHRMLAARDVDALDRILVLEDRVPHHDRGAGDPRSAAMLSAMAELWPEARITLLAAEARNADVYAPPLRRAGIEVAPDPGDWEGWFETRAFHYGVVVVCRPDNFKLFRGSIERTQPQAGRVYDMEALYHVRMQRAEPFLGPDDDHAAFRGQMEEFRDLEHQAVRWADAVFCVTEEEREYVRAMAPEVPAYLLPGFVEPVREPAGFDQRRDLLFFGGFMGGRSSPNADALRHFAADMLPTLLDLHPDLVLRVIGAEPPDEVLALAGPNAEVVGYVPDPAPFLNRARVHVAPLRFGSGIKQKLLDSMAAGLPFVTSPVGAEGLGLGDLEPHVVADDPSRAVELVSALYTERNLWEEVQRGLLRLARERFGTDAFRRTLTDAMIEFGLAPPARTLVSS